MLITVFQAQPSLYSFSGSVDIAIKHVVNGGISYVSINSSEHSSGKISADVAGKHTVGSFRPGLFVPWLSCIDVSCCVMVLLRKPRARYKVMIGGEEVFPHTIESLNPMSSAYSVSAPLLLQQEYQAI